MTSSTQGPYVDLESSSNDQERGMEMDPISPNRMKKSRSRPDVSSAELLKALISAALLIIIVFWINAAHIYGIFRHQGAYTHRARVAVADFDKSDLGEALQLSIAMNNGSFGHPTYVNLNTSGSSVEQVQHEVFKGTYWAAIVVHHGATDRFETAVNGTATDYDSSDVFTYYVFDARYYTLYASNILSTTVTTVSAAGSIFSARFITPLLASSEYANTTAALSAITGPALAVEMPVTSLLFANLDDKAFINTIGTVLPILLQFFFIMAWNGICNSMHLYAAYDPRIHKLARLFWGTVWPLFTSLCVTGWTFAFRGSYFMDAKMFFAFWAVTWVYNMINFDLLDIVIGFISLAFVPLILLTWIIFSVAASLGPEDILHHWYRINYFFPSLHWYQTLVTILTQGGYNNLHYNLPVLAAWLVLTKCLSPLATKNRTSKAHEVFKWYNERNAIGGPH
jgi:hypothetical protein